jgi:hypothetical protein
MPKCPISRSSKPVTHRQQYALTMRHKNPILPRNQQKQKKLKPMIKNTRDRRRCVTRHRRGRSRLCGTRSGVCVGFSRSTSFPLPLARDSAYVMLRLFSASVSLSPLSASAFHLLFRDPRYPVPEHGLPIGFPVCHDRSFPTETPYDGCP